MTYSNSVMQNLSTQKICFQTWTELWTFSWCQCWCCIHHMKDMTLEEYTNKSHTRRGCQLKETRSGLLPIRANADILKPVAVMARDSAGSTSQLSVPHIVLLITSNPASLTISHLSVYRLFWPLSAFVTRFTDFSNPFKNFLSNNSAALHGGICSATGSWWVRSAEDWSTQHIVPCASRPISRAFTFCYTRSQEELNLCDIRLLQDE